MGSNDNDRRAAAIEVHNLKGRWQWLLWLLLVEVVTAACSTDTTKAPSSQPQGPALLMFYTDG